MKARQQSTGGDFQPIDVGVHAGVCTLVADLGLQRPNNPQFKEAYKILIGFQIPSELRSDGEPQMLTRIETSSMHKKANLRKLIEGWFGKSFSTDEDAQNFDLKNLLGKGAFLNVTHTQKGDKTYANIASIVPLAKGVEKPTPVGSLVFYDESGGQSLADRSASYQLLPEWVRKKVDAQVRAPGDGPGDAPASREPGEDDEIPF